ncbi:multiple sugar transport system permease protein [Kaistia hirudinis]|uniref:Multiple sugar transport system permease protein n=1 Tax=Kaistia hirudinis TaxID=1293440 RepID=A0A840ASH8_9HYPH|nr:sugar ABC transporter permease [Kaistia hirudinis]MBB3931425.1 multiple sugar transport system permease protein [Kaistia hirudinis]
MAHPDNSAPAPHRRTEVSNLSFALIISIPVLVFLLIVVAYPLAYAFYLSFNEIRFFGGYSADWVGLTNYANVLYDPSFWSSLGRTLRFTVETVILTLAIGLGLALILKHLPPGWRWLRALIILPWAVSPYGAGIFFAYLGRGQTGIGTSVAAALGSDQTFNLISANFVMEYLALGAAWNMAPLVAFFLLANMLTTPPRLYDLAKIDQMSHFETFWHVTLPPLRFTIFVFSCITTVLAMKTFDYIFTETQGGPGSASAVLTYTLYKISFVNLDLGYGAAMSFFLLAVILGSTGILYFIWGRKEERQ